MNIKLTRPWRSIVKHLHDGVVKADLQFLVAWHKDLLREEHEDQFHLGVDAEIGAVAASPAVVAGLSGGEVPNA